MNDLTKSGIAIIIAIPCMGGWLVGPMRFFTNLGSEEFFFLVLPIIYWSIDASFFIYCVISVTRWWGGGWQAAHRGYLYN